MRHEQIKATDSYTKVEIVAVWPKGVQAPPLPLVEENMPHAQQATLAAPDVPSGVGVLILGSYVLMVGTMALATIASAYSIYMITIVAFLLAAFFAVPWLFFKQEGGNGARPGLEQFMQDGMETLTGHSSGGAALVQMMIVPVLLTLCAAAIGVTAAIFL